MLPELSDLWKKLENRRRELFDVIDQLSEEQLRFRPEPDRWSILQVLQHVVRSEEGMLRSEVELRDNPLLDILKPGNLYQVVKDILEKDVPVGVPDPSLEPDGQTTVDELRATWDNERNAMGKLLETLVPDNVERVMFSHAAAGPLTALQMLEIAVAHLDNHRRQIDRICEEITT